LSKRYGLNEYYKYTTGKEIKKHENDYINIDANGFRLPTEAEWEYAAHGGGKSKGYEYSGSNYINDVAWCYGNSGGKTHPVGIKQPNEPGIYDMSGNVWEWCEDRYSSNRKCRVLRGGSWGNSDVCTAARPIASTAPSSIVTATPGSVLFLSHSSL